MFRRFASFFLALLFIISFIISGPTYASDILTLDDLDIDPWADMEHLTPAAPAAAEPEDEPQQDDQAAALISEAEGEEQGSGDEGIMPVNLLPDIAPAVFKLNGKMSYRYGYDYSYNGSSYVYGSSSTGTIFNNFQYAPSSFSGTLNYKFFTVSLPSRDYCFFIGTAPAFTMTYTKNFSSQLENGGHFSLQGSITSYLSNTGSRKLFSTLYPTSGNIVFYSGQTEVARSSFSSPKNGVFTLEKTIIDIPVGGFTSFTVTFNFSSFNPSVSISSNPSSGWVKYGAMAYIDSDFSMYVKDDLIGGPVSQEEINGGLLSGLIEIVTGIYKTVTSLPGQITNIVTEIAALPGKIVTAIIDGLKSLFVPSEADLQQLQAKYSNLFEMKLGFVYQMFSWVVNSFGRLQQAFSVGEDYQFDFPGLSFSVNGETFTFLPAQTVDLDNELMALLRPIAGTAVSIIAVFAFFSTGFHMVLAFLSGKSYADFLKGGGDDG